MADQDHDALAKAHAHTGGGGHGAPHGGEDHEEHEGAPEWLISFADNTALMMGFFVILLALNMGPKGGGAGREHGSAAGQPTAAELDWALSVREAFNNPVRLDSTNPGEAILVRRLRQRLQDAQDDGPPGQNDRLQSLKRGDYFGLASEVEFAPFSSSLTDPARESLEALARDVRGLQQVIELRAHVSAVENTLENDHGQKLAYDRAMAVSGALTNLGLNPKQLRLVLCGDYEPVAYQAYSTQMQRQNQRVEIVFTDDLLSDHPTAQPSDR